MKNAGGTLTMRTKGLSGIPNRENAVCGYDAPWWQIVEAL